MKLVLRNKTALVTGASSGMGKEIATKVASDVKRLILVARTERVLELLAIECMKNNSGLKVFVIPCDLTNVEAVKLLVHRIKTKIGNVDILVNAAGVGQTAFFEDTSVEEINKVIQINSMVSTYLCHAFLPDMIKQGSGGILNFSSFFGQQILPGYAVYVASKHYITGLTKVLRAEVSGTGVVVSCVHPGPVKSDFWNTENADLFSPPSFLFISIEQCVRETLSGFRRDRAVIIPGLRIKLLMAFLDLAPKLIVRMVNARVGRMQRTKKEIRKSGSIKQSINTRNNSI